MWNLGNWVLALRGPYGLRADEYPVETIRLLTQVLAIVKLGITGCFGRLLNSGDEGPAGRHAGIARN
jgi:hypothetical protein